MNTDLIKKYLKKQKIKVVETFDFDNKNVKYSEDIIGWKIDKFRGDEEVVRAYLLAKLVNELGYKIKNIELERTYTIRGGRQEINPRIDVIVKDEHENPFLFIEVKAPDKYEIDKKNIEGQLFSLAESEEKKNKTKVSHLVYYTIDIVNNKIEDNFILIDKSIVKDFSDWVEKGTLSYANLIPKNYNKPEKKLLKIDDLKILDRDKLSKIRTNIHNTLWSAGVEDNEAYLFLVKYLLTKIYDEQNTNSKKPLECQIYDNDFKDEKNLFDRINKIYFKALKDKLNYNEKDLEATGKILSQEKISLKSLYFLVEELEKYSFTKSLKEQNEDILGAFFEETNREKFKQDKGQFFTHTNVVKFLIYGMKLDELSLSLFFSEKRLPYVIDPSAGSGTFLIELMKTITSLFKSIDKSDFTDTQNTTYEKFFAVNKPNTWAEKYLYGVDNSYSLAISSKVNMILHGDGSSNIIKSDGIVNFQHFKNLDDSMLSKYSKANVNIYGVNNQNSNFLITENFDAVLSNPPFSVNPIEDEKERAKHFLFGSKKNSENLFIERWYQLLKPKGHLGVVLPESAFDTTENKYIRLFIYKYFNVKAVVSLPQLTFEPFTSTKTSLLFAQKKSDDEIKLWNDKWNHYSLEWSKLSRRVKNYVKILDGEDEKKFTSINKDFKAVIKKAKKDKVEYSVLIKLLEKILKRNKGEEDIESLNENELNALSKDKVFKLFESEIKEAQFLTNTKRLLKDYLSSDDDELNVKELILKYRDEIEQLCKYDYDTKDAFGFVNTWWVFGEVAKELNYKIFMAEVENIGYKRTKRGEKPMPNELFDLKIAPDIFDFNKYKECIDRKIKDFNDIIQKSNDDLKTIKNKNGIKDLKLKIKYFNDKKNELENEFKEITNNLKNIYDKNWKIKDPDRTNQKELKQLFSNENLKSFFSEDVLLRTNNTITALDYLRKLQWD